MEFLTNLGLFAGKTALVTAAAIVVSGFVFMLFNRGRSRPQLEVESLNDRYDALARALKESVFDKKRLKADAKADKKKKKAEKKGAADERPRVFVLDFDGDVRASALQCLREEITAVLSLEPTAQDEVVVRIESPGGLVNAYGLAAAQLERVRERGVPLVACVDKVAASGGYMMACVANRIVAAPFAAIGSIGVVAGLPNVHRLLKKHDVDYREVTAGEYKRTVSVLGEITPQGLEKFREQIDETHDLFKRHVRKWRPALDLAKIATGEHWYGVQALDLGLIDALQTSDDYLMAKRKGAEVFQVRFHAKKSLSDKLAANLSDAAAHALGRAWTFARNSEFGR